MNMTRISWLLIGLPALAIAGCNLRNLENRGEITATEMDCGSVNPDTEVVIDAETFSPREVSVKDGGVVRWLNQSTKRQTVTSGEAGRDDAGSLFNSGELQAGDRYCLEFKGNGTTRYFSEDHPREMRGGTIMVGEAGDIEDRDL